MKIINEAIYSFFEEKNNLKNKTKLKKMATIMHNVIVNVNKKNKKNFLVRKNYF